MNNPDTEDRRLQLSAKEIRLAADDIRKLRWIDREGALDRLAAFCDQRADEIAAVASAAPPESQMPNTPDTDWINSGVEAVVTVAEIIESCGVRWANLRIDDHVTTTSVRADCLRPLPPPLSPTAQRVVEAAMAEEQARTIFRAGGGGERGLPRLRAVWELTQSQTSAAVAEHLATLRPADPLAVAMEAIKEMLLHFGNPRREQWLTDDGWEDAKAACAEARAAILLIERGGKGEG